MGPVKNGVPGILFFDIFQRNLAHLYTWEMGMENNNLKVSFKLPKK
jgi:hypothetical protein